MHNKNVSKIKKKNKPISYVPCQLLLTECGLWMTKVMKMSETTANPNEEIKYNTEHKDK